MENNTVLEINLTGNEIGLYCFIAYCVLSYLLYIPFYRWVWQYDLTEELKVITSIGMIAAPIGFAIITLAGLIYVIGIILSFIQKILLFGVKKQDG